MPDRRPRVVIAAHGRYHAFDLARELHLSGHLARLTTTYPAFAARRMVSASAPIKAAPWLELWRRAHGRVPRVPDPDPGLAKAFARFAARSLPGSADILVGWSAGILEAIIPARERGMKVIVERGSTHIVHQTDTLAEEYRSFGLPWRATRRETIEREIAEYQAADAIVTPSYFAAGTFIARGIDRAKIHVNPLGVDPSRFAAVERPVRHRPTILFVGRVGLRKGVPWLLRGFAPLAGRARLRLVGPVESGMEKIFSAEPTEGVEITGPLHRDALTKALAGADIFCLPSIEEGFGLALLEAMAAALPVVTTDVTGAGEAVGNGTEGLVVPVHDTASITAALATLIDDPHRRREMGRSARARVARDFGWDRYGARALAIYDRVLGTT